MAGTVPIGYEMPKAEQRGVTGRAAGAGAMNVQPHLGFSGGNDYYNTGKMGTNWGTGFPVTVTGDLMERGKQRFNINCAICHGATAAGNGITKQYGLATVVSLQDERIRNMADGEIFNTITHGKNTMMAYGPNVTVTDRWAIIAYLRALQRSQNATEADVPPGTSRGAGQAGRTPTPEPPNRRRQEMSERSDVMPMPEGEYFETNRFARSLVAARRSSVSSAWGSAWSALSFHRINSVSRGFSPLPFYFTLLRRLFLLDHRPPRDRRGMVGGGPPAAGEPGHARRRSWRCSSSRS